MSNIVETDIIRHIHDNSNGYIIVKPWPDAPDSTVEICTDKFGEDYFGKFSIVVSKEVARQLGLAIVACSVELCDNKDK